MKVSDYKKGLKFKIERLTDDDLNYLVLDIRQTKTGRISALLDDGFRKPFWTGPQVPHAETPGKIIN